MKEKALQRPLFLSPDNSSKKVEWVKLYLLANGPVTTKRQHSAPRAKIKNQSELMLREAPPITPALHYQYRPPPFMVVFYYLHVTNEYRLPPTVSAPSPPPPQLFFFYLFFLFLFFCLQAHFVLFYYFILFFFCSSLLYFTIPLLHKGVEKLRGPRALHRILGSHEVLLSNLRFSSCRKASLLCLSEAF